MANITVNGVQYTLGSTEATNALLADASKTTGIAPQTFTTPTLVPNTAPTISADSLTKPVTPAPLPPATTDTTNYSSIINGGNATIAALTPPAQTTEMPDYLKKYLEGSAPTDPMAQYNTDYAASGIDAKQQAVNDSTNKINALKAELQGINAETKVAELKLPGEGISAGAIAGRNVANEREAAIRALPIQAQILAEQAKLTGNTALLQQAQDKFNQVFKIHSDYATQLFNYDQAKRDAVFQYADKQQQIILDQQKQQANQAFALLQNNLNYAQQLAVAAINAGQSDVAAQITKLNPYATNYTTQLSALSSQIQPKVSTTTPSSVQEYEYAKQQGYTGTYQQWVDRNRATTSGDKLLSVLDAQRLGVPYGTTQQQAINMGLNVGSTGGSSGGTASSVTGGQITDFSGTTFNGLIATLPDGSTLQFPSQTALDQFKKDNGLTSPTSSTSPTNMISSLRAPTPAPLASLGTAIQSGYNTVKNWFSNLF